MNFRLIALASCVALGSIAFGGKAQAQIAEFFTPNDIILSSAGTFGQSCTVSTAQTAGVLRQSGTTTITSNPTVSGASPAEFLLTCTGSVGFIVRPTVPTVSSTALAGTATLVATLRDGTTSIASSTLTTTSANTTVVGGFTDKPFNLVHVATNAGGLTPGPYAFDTNVTITPQ